MPEPGPSPIPLRKESVLKRMGRGVRYMLNLPDGFTFWVKIPREKKEKQLANHLAMVSASTAAASIGLSFFLGHRPPLEIMGAATGLFAWVWLNIYYFRAVQEVMTQGKVLNVQDGKTITLNRANLFLWSANFMRGLITNAFINLGRFGFVGVAALATGDVKAALLAAAGIFVATFSKVSIQNAIINVFARSQVDKWITQKTPTPKEPEGTPGKLNVREASWLRTVWEFSYGLLKNLDLIRTGKKGDAKSSLISGYVYKAMAIGSIFWLARDMKGWVKSEMGRVREKIKGEAPKCEAFFMLPQPLNSPLAATALPTSEI